ncbi:hypothetical protein [Butyricimonas synergistica]|uniref:hypothetical protein n=1 Tax=Butyricimonas synergistica TaxID=544644 RepID=UPI0003700C55|nr:hypothetical protein [Butyricimonas synergistica]
MVEIKSGVLKDAKGQYKGMVIFQKGKKTFGRALPSYDGNAGSATRAAQNARMAAVVTLYQSIKKTYLYDTWRMEATRKEIISGYNLFIQTNLQAYNANYSTGDFRLLHLTLGTLQIPFQMWQQEAPAGMISLIWETTPWSSDRRNKDELALAVIYDNEPFRVEIIDHTGTTRADGRTLIPLENPSAREAHVYAFFMNQEKDKFTNSIYFNVQLK